MTRHILLLLILFSMKANALIFIVAAENIYGEVAKELGGPYVQVVNILNNPTEDPHLFATTPSVSKAASRADIIIFNGADYDPWIQSILNSRGVKNRTIINVADLNGIKSGENPHIWYQPTVVPIFAKSLVSTLMQLDKEHQSYYENQLQKFNQSYQIIFQKINYLKNHFQHTPVIATEPVFGYMAKSIGLTMHGESFQLNVMNDTPPSISQIKSFEDDLIHHKVVLLIYNQQVINPLTHNMEGIAKRNHIPIVGISEMLPRNLSYVEWMIKTLNELQNALEESEQQNGPK